MSNPPARTPADWWRVFGPGAVIASLTIGAGELIFSSRGGALFGYELLWFFLLVLLFKWALLYGAARQMVLTGAHPFQRWLDLPGPRGWLPLALLLLAVLAFPIWVAFHAAAVGTLISWLTGTQMRVQGSAHYLWGLALLGCVMVLVWRGGYATLERVQLAIVSVMLVAVVASLILLNPPWLEILQGLILPRALHYPAWAADQAELVGRPVWVETVTYVGVIGGSAYDYLAYVSYLRDKQWGYAGQGMATPAELRSLAANPSPARSWLRLVVIDCTMSFTAVLVFTCVFVTCGAMILGPQHKIPAGSNLLALQAEFVSAFSWMKPLYFLGAFLTMLGTLYGTIEVAPAVLREVVSTFNSEAAARHSQRLRRASVLWVGGGAWVVLSASFIYVQLVPGGVVPGLVGMLTPANLFTGVLAAGLICLLNPWSDGRYLPPPLRMSVWLRWLNGCAGVVFVLIGLKAYWDHSQWRSLAILGGTVAAGALLAMALNRRRRTRP